MTSPSTFEQTFHQRLLDLLYGQWTALGASFSVQGQDDSEVIDPEALIWCSLEFLPTEPRLYEALLLWIGRNPHYLVRQRLAKQRDGKDPRTLIWAAIDRRSRAEDRPVGINIEPIYDPDASVDIEAFVPRLKEASRPPRNSSRLGSLRKTAATVLVRSRDLLGHDIRHFLLVYLLAHSHGAKIRDIRGWSGHAYGSLFDAAERWRTADIVTLDNGYCRLIRSEQFRQLLHLDQSPLILVNWWTVFDISIRLLRDLAKARRKGFEANHGINAFLKEEAGRKLNELSSSPSLQFLLECFASTDVQLV